jgi:hypothetical protein
MSRLERRTLEGVGRVYFSEDHELYLPSVTTVLSQKKTPIALKRWKQNNDDWEEIMNRKGSRGTLIHYNCLNEFAEEDMHGKNESDSKEHLKEIGRWEWYEDGMEWAEGAWEAIKHKQDITDETVLNVECFVENTDIGYAGQFDLLYVDSNNSDVVMADLKTSSGVYNKHKMQLSAYKNAVNLGIDRLEVIRMHPDSKTYEVSSSRDWDENPDELFAEFVELREGMDSDLDKVAEEGVDDG